MNGSSQKLRTALLLQLAMLWLLIALFKSKTVDEITISLTDRLRPALI